MKKSFYVISKNKIKLIKSLEYKKYREISGLFVAEGNKLVKELIDSTIAIESLIATPEFLEQVRFTSTALPEILSVSKDEIKSASLLKNPQDAIALCRIPEYNPDIINPSEDLVICLDGIQDPGNLGTIIRLADWFGIRDIVCSPGSADLFNPKAIQATMGSVCRVRVHYIDLWKFLSQFAEKIIPVTGAFIHGENLYTTHLPATGILVMGSEGRGISDNLIPLITKKISIPSFSPLTDHAESLNVAVATAIICAEIRRKNQIAYSK